MRVVALTLATILVMGEARAEPMQAGIDDARPRDGFALGRAIAKRDCGGCHAVDHQGDSPLAGAPRFRDLHRRYPVEQLGEALAEGIVVGHGPMPVWVFGPQEVEALTAYLKSLEPDVPARTPRP